MSIKRSNITIIDPDLDFFELYPNYKLGMEFKKFYTRDRTKNKQRSSKIMWFVVLTRDPSSIFYNLPQEEKDQVVGEDYMGDKDFYKKNKEELDLIIADYERLTLTPAKQHLLSWDKKIQERTEFINNTKYTLDNFDSLDKMASNTAKIFETLEKIKEDLSKEEADGTIKGGGAASLNDD